MLPFAPNDEYKDEISKIKSYVKINQSFDGLTKYLELILIDWKKAENAKRI